MKLSLVFSDIELGSGTKTDDFVEEKLLCRTIKNYFPETKKHETKLILNGDIFDFLKTSYGDSYPKHITEKVSLHKLEKISNAHPLFFKTLKNFLLANEKTEVIFILGNHDYDLIFPKVQEKLKDIIVWDDKALTSRILFPGFSYTQEGIHYEHGSQLDTFFRVDPDNFIYQCKKDAEPILLIPWGYSAIYDYFIQLKEAFPLWERLFPKRNVIDLLPKNYKTSLVLHSIKYLFKSFFITQVIYFGDRLYRFKLTEFISYVKSLLFGRFELLITKEAKKKLKKRNFKIICIGHNHQGSLYQHEKGYILNTSCWRDEYFLNEKDNTFYPKEKAYGYILHTENKIHKIKLIKVKSMQKPLPLEKIKKLLKKEKKIDDVFLEIFKI